MNSTTKVDKSVKQNILTLKAGKKRTESVPTKKRQLLSHFISNKKIKIALILCNQKRSVTSTLKYLGKEYPDNIFALGDLSKKEFEEHINSFKNQSLFLVATNAQLKDFDLKGNITHIIHFDFPTRVEDFITHIHIANTQLASTNGKPAEIWSFVSLDDEKYFQKITLEPQINMQLGRLKGHRNANIGIDLQTKKGTETEASKEKSQEKKAPPKIKKKAVAKHEKKPTEKVELSESPKKSKSQPKKKKEEKVSKANPKPEKEEATEKSRSRRRKTQETQERLPKKRIRRRQNDKIVEAEREEKPAIVEASDNEIKLDIEIKQIIKPKIRRNPQGRIIGMGEHTPAFMLKEIIFKNSTLEVDDE